MVTKARDDRPYPDRGAVFQRRANNAPFAFTPAALERFCALPRGVYEMRENLEQLRWLEAGESLRVVPATIHIPLADVPRVLTAALLEQVIRLTSAGLIRDFGIARPRIAVAGLNPHAGEGGAMGGEEIAMISPLLQRLQAEGFDLRGPLSADTMFHARARAGYDAAVCMYHDQALIPIKTLDFDGGVNVTLGLPFVRTSPDHGTAFDIAGTGKASAESLIQALLLADKMANARARA